MANIAIMGHGVIGSGVSEILINDNRLIAEKSGEDICVKHILDLRDFSSLPYGEIFTKDFEDIAGDSSLDIVVEAMGGIHPAYDFTKRLLEKGISVITSNKEVVSRFGVELIHLAHQNNCNYLFEASVGGGVPIIRPMRTCLAANNFNFITGIVNGTTNYMLTQMQQKNIDFATALKQAQDLGYAEKDPTADIEGYDAARKISILASIAWGKYINPDWISTKGVSDVTIDMINKADKSGCIIRLIARAERLENGKITAFVAPCLIPKSHILSCVSDVFNGIIANGDKTGDILFYGKGAGKLATASAVVGDVVDCIKHKHITLHNEWSTSGDYFEGFNGQYTEFMPIEKL